MQALIIALAIAGTPFSSAPNLIAEYAPHLDGFWALGFSRDHRFAYAVQGGGDQAVEVTWDVVVVDLVTDRVLARSQAVDETGGNAPPAGFLRSVDTLLSKHGIEHPGKYVHVPFVAEQSFDVALRTTGSLDSNNEQPRDTYVYLVRDSQRKKIGQVHESGFLDSEPPKVLGAVLSPYERRAAILLVDASYGGCVGARWSVVVLGADLDERF